MKKNVCSIMAAGIAAVLMLNSANAQIAMNNSPKADAGFKTIDKAYSATNRSAGENNFRALKDFKTRFTAIETTGAAWYKKDNGYIAKFSVNSIQTIVAYGKHGDWRYTIRRYDEKKLPADVRALVKSTYYDYTIFHIDEVKVPQQEATIFIVLLLDEKSMKTLRVQNDEMEVIGDFVRG